jgi:hypothetical protein
MDQLNFIWQHRNDDVESLALQAHQFSEVDMCDVLTQIAGWQIARVKVPSWANCSEIRYPVHLSMEQCSSESTACYKASLVGGDSLVDLTGGFGVDCAFLSTKFAHTYYIERQDVLCKLACHNFSVLRLHIEVLHEDGLDFLRTMPRVDCLFIDPARRNEQGAKVIAIGDCEPDVTAYLDLLLDKGMKVFLKLSPMLDLTKALHDLQGRVGQAHIVSVDNECKELLLILDKDEHIELSVTCVNIRKDGWQTFNYSPRQEEDAACVWAETLGEYLYEPNASLLKAGCFKSVALYYGLKKLHPNSHLFTSNVLIDEFMGRKFCIERVIRFSKKELKEGLRGIEKANITVRNFPSSVADLRKRLKIKEGGDSYLFATTLSDNKKVLILCR